MALRVKIFTSANTSPMISESVPSADGLVDIDSVQTVSNKTFVNSTFNGQDPTRLGLLLFKASILGQFTFGGQIGVCPGLVNFINPALAMV